MRGGGFVIIKIPRGRETLNRNRRSLSQTSPPLCYLKQQEDGTTRKTEKHAAGRDSGAPNDPIFSLAQFVVVRCDVCRRYNVT